MQRILVIGSPGAGKSTLSHQLAERTGLPLHHLDQLFWLSGWVAYSMRSGLPSGRSRQPSPSRSMKPCRSSSPIGASGILVMVQTTRRSAVTGAGRRW